MNRTTPIASIVLALFAHAPNKSPTPIKPPATHGTSKLPPLPPPLPMHVWLHPTPPLPMLPSVGRVRVEAARDHVVLVEDVNLPRGDWESGPLELYVAFGAPGTPLAVDAHVLPGPGASAEAHADENGEALTVETAIRRTPGSQMLLGKAQMAGIVIHVKESQLKRQYAVGSVAVLRIRSLLSAPGLDADGSHGVVVRLGVSGGVPLTLGRIQVMSRETQPSISRVEAALCGPDATALPLSVSLLAPAAKGSDAPARPVTTIAPEMAVRHPSDDLCIRWWTET